MKLDYEVKDYEDHIRFGCDFNHGEICFKSGVFQSCVPIRFQEIKDSDVTRNRRIWEGLILVYSKKLKVARKNGYGLYLEGDNGVGKTMFMSYVLVEAVRYGYSAYYSTTSDLEHTMQQGFSDRAIAERMEEMLWSDFFGLDELGGEQVKAGSTWVKMQVERVLKFRLDNRLPTVVATNSSTRKILNCYGPSVSSVLNGNSYQRVLFENGDCRKEGREKMRSEIGYKK